MTFPPAPGRTDGYLLRRAGVLLSVALILGACSSSEESLSGADQQTPAETADGETSADGDADTADEETPDDEIGDDLPFGEDDAPDEPEPVPFVVDDLTDLSAPEEVIKEVAAELPQGVEAENVLDAIKPIDTDIDLTTDREGRTTNGQGELVGLDESASLACANIEIALTELDEGNGVAAAGQVTTAAERAGSSEMPSVQAWSEPLAAAVIDGAVTEFAPLVGFISVCAEGGYEL